jgi:hypothetical protein
MNDIIGLSPQQLRQAANLQEQIQKLQQQLKKLLGAPTEPAAPEPSKTRKFSAATRAKMKAAQKARWAKLRGNEKPVKVPEAPKKKRALTPALKAALEKAWAARRTKKPAKA